MGKKIRIFKSLGYAKMPEYQTEGAAGFDLRAYLGSDKEHAGAKDGVVLMPGKMFVFRTGLAMQIPKNHELEIRPRSGLGFKGVTLSNSPGTIDSDYRGELKLCLINHGSNAVMVESGDRVAQGLLRKVDRAQFEEEEIALDSSERGQAGFGSTGVS